MTRDDLKLKIGVGVAVIVALATLNDTTVRLLGFPIWIVPCLPYCRLAAFVSGIVSAQLGTSPLPGTPSTPVREIFAKLIASAKP
jgi:hypothetical protein